MSDTTAFVSGDELLDFFRPTPQEVAAARRWVDDMRRALPQILENSRAIEQQAINEMMVGGDSKGG